MPSSDDPPEGSSKSGSDPTAGTPQAGDGAGKPGAESSSAGAEASPSQASSSSESSPTPPQPPDAPRKKRSLWPFSLHTTKVILTAVTGVAAIFATHLKTTSTNSISALNRSISSDRQQISLDRLSANADLAQDLQLMSHFYSTYALSIGTGNPGPVSFLGAVARPQFRPILARYIEYVGTKGGFADSLESSKIPSGEYNRWARDRAYTRSIPAIAKATARRSAIATKQGLIGELRKRLSYFATAQSFLIYSTALFSIALLSLHRRADWMIFLVGLIPFTLGMMNLVRGIEGLGTVILIVGPLLVAAGPLVRHFDLDDVIKSALGIGSRG